MKKVKSLIVSLTAVFACFFASSQRLILPGDYPDPSIIKIGDSYWASATTSNWMPAYPILKSADMVHWTTEGYIFNKLPDWADYYFWAPEITYENGKVYVYYSAHKKGGNLCLGIATADKPEGPYKDLGPMMCEEAGSIDAFPMRDENGKLYLIWKEDGNSIKQPTPIWAMEMKEDRTGLIGEKHELFRNKVAWEENLVEGVSMMKHGGYYYAFYAAAGCCGVGCNYIVGIARSKNLLGPWEKDPANPVLKNNEQWICPGHGTPIEKDGRYYFLHHAYDKKTNAFTGRQGVLSEFKFTPDGWVKFVNIPEPFATPAPVADDFNNRKLSVNWQWSVFQKEIKYKLRKGHLELKGSNVSAGAFMGQKILTGDFTARVDLLKKGTKPSAGIAAIGDDKNTLSLLYSGDSVRLIKLKDDTATVLASLPLTAKQAVNFKMQATGGRYYTFSVAADNGSFTPVNTKPIDGLFLPPWDRAVRAGVVSKGNGKAKFASFQMAGD
ncbi:family 43 glycosylhydrolase [Segetibacter sp.]|uniref:family 43 glycosylhydrolase n=1 Tax=Segetibacter sp. TaxID=2231182 RepID=UPI0026202B38|nr:family 43 glycosylhydrolase [Segetibacter sp.]MCW3081010.1 Beta-xylosidase [Segetibacter sp.]